MDSLAAIVLDDVTVLGGTATHQRIADRFPGWVDNKQAERVEAAVLTQRDSISVFVQPRRIQIGTQATKVLSNLQHVLASAPDGLPMFRIDTPELVVTSQVDKVLESLLDVRQRSGDLRAPRAPRSKTAQQRLSDMPMSAGDRAGQSSVISGSEGQPQNFNSMARATSGLTNGTVDIALDLPDAADRHTALDVDLSQPMPVDSSASPLSKPAPVPTADSQTGPFGDARVAVSETSLDRVRGGFVSNGLNLSFGVERAVYMNGALVVTTSLNVSDLGKVTAGAASKAVDAGALALIQSGSGNTFNPGTTSTTSYGTVVQNTLDGQKIQNLTVINATANSLNVLRGLNLQSSLRGAVIDSLRR